ncbi:MAG: alpha-amylase/4-alpha-glucanotransferase domain-containing protein [Treponema sp.]
MNKENIDVCFVLHVDYTYIEELNKINPSNIYGDIFSCLHDHLQNLPFTISPSGSFINWVEEKNMPFLYLLKNMVFREQVEILGGAFYEPFFPIVQSNDVFGQVELLTEILCEHFGQKPHGCFIPYSAWDESVILPLRKSGIEYCLLDSRFFKASGLNMYKPACLEHNGKTIFAIPFESALTNAIEFSPSDYYENILKLAKQENSCIIVPLTKETLHACIKRKNKAEKSWFEEFLSVIKDSYIRLTHVGKVIKNEKIHQRGMIASNAILNDKVLDSSIKKHIFMDEDLRLLYCKMQYVYALCNQIRGEKSRKNTALQDLWKAQSAVLFDLENKNRKHRSLLMQYCYRNLLLSEKQTRIPGKFSTSILSYDFDMDGVKEFLFQREDINMYVHYIGGKVFEMDVLNVYKNYTYMVNEHGLFIDHLVSAKDLEKIQENDYRSIRANSVFANNFYQYVSHNNIKKNLQFKTEGMLKLSNAIAVAVSLKKKYTLTDDSMEVQYILKNDSSITISSFFMVEMSLLFEANNKKAAKISVYTEDVKQELSIEELNVCHAFKCIPWLQIVGIDGRIKFVMELNEQANIILIPIYGKDAETINNCIGLRILFYWNVELEPEHDTEKMMFFRVLDSKKKQGEY